MTTRSYDALSAADQLVAAAQEQPFVLGVEGHT